MNELKVTDVYFLGAPKQVAAGAASAQVVLTPGIDAVRLTADGAKTRFELGDGDQVATATSHYIESNQSITVGVPRHWIAPKIAAMRQGLTSGVLEISELTKGA